MVKSENGIDRISNLPDALISHILSLLPTKCAVATSVLSTRWKFLWTSITNLDFEIDGAECHSENELGLKMIKFTHFVNMVLLLPDSPPIQNFRLKCSKMRIDPSYLNSWIRVAFGRIVRKLGLVLMLNEHLELPLSHICCNVVVLKLEGDIRFVIPAETSVCFRNLRTLRLRETTFAIATDSCASFPNLKILSLSYVSYANEDSVHKLFSSCPVLDNLLIQRDGSDNLPFLIIRIPSLKTLTLQFKFLDEIAYRLQIDTPALQYLDLEDNFLCEYLPADSLSSLLRATVRVDFSDDDEVDVESCNDILKFIGCLSKVRFLSVLGDALTIIRAASARISICFDNVSTLKLQEQDCLDFSVVINFLENMDNLEHLVLKGYCKYHYHESWWTEPVDVPNCLMGRVTTIDVSYLVGHCCDDQLEQLRYLLKNAKVLQQLTISTRRFSKTEKHELVEKISMFPRGSQTCQVTFT